MSQKNNKISIMCPNCGKFILKANEDDDRKNKVQCRSCHKLICYIPSGNYREIRKPPARTTSSGMRFY